MDLTSKRLLAQPVAQRRARSAVLLGRPEGVVQLDAGETIEGGRWRRTPTQPTLPAAGGGIRWPPPAALPAAHLRGQGLMESRYVRGGMRARLSFVRQGKEQELVLSGASWTIGRAPGCELQIADERISSRHCRLWPRGDGWMIEDLMSTNRTFVNGEQLVQPRRLAHGDLVRLGAIDAVLLEARFLIREQSVERTAPAVADALRATIARLEATVAERDAELGRIRAMYKRAQSELADRDAAAMATRQASAMMAREIEALREDLQHARAEHAGCGDAAALAHKRCAELEGQERRSRKRLDDEIRLRKDLETELGVVSSRLAAVTPHSRP